MAHSYDGKSYRYTFIFAKENITESLNKELQDYILAYLKQKEEETGGGTLCNIYAYDDTIFVTEEETKVTPVYVVVLYGVDWMNFISDLLDFHDTFPPGKIVRESNYSHILKDENQLFDDFN